MRPLRALALRPYPEPLRGRVFRLLSEHGVPDARGVLLPLRLSQQDLANLIGVTRESVNLARADFRRQGLVEMDRRSLRILAPDELRQLA